MKSIHVLTAFLFLSIIAYSSTFKIKHQRFVENSLYAFSKRSFWMDSSWQQDTTLQGVSFYYKIISCANEDAVLLAIQNNNNSVVSFSWSDEVWVDGVIGASNSNKTYILNVAESKEGECGSNDLKLFQIKLRDISTSGNHLTGFHFRNIHIIL